MNIFFELHNGIPREGPGNRTSTRKAYKYLNLPNEIQILDIGCGPGDQTLELAHLSSSSITAVDIHEPFLHDLNKRAIQEGVSKYIKTLKASMFDLKSPEEYFDVIWSEGAIYIMGFAKGLRAWRKFLKPGGYMVVTELTWLSKRPSAEANTFWNANYPDMKSIDENLTIILESGYEAPHHFVLPEEAWWEDYYKPLERKITILKEQYTNNTAAIDVLNGAQLEIDLFRKYSNEYGYVFYIMKKSSTKLHYD